MRIVLLRHGRTEANERQLYCGATDIPLSAAGRNELLRLRETVRYPSPEGMRMLTSGMRRADETMRILYERCPDERIDGLREMDFGEFEMHSYDELRGNSAYQEWIMDSAGDVRVPCGESANSFRERVLEAFHKIDGDSIVVCHGGVIAAIMAHCFPGMERNMYQWQPGHGLGYILDFQGDELRWRIIGAENVLME